MSLGGCNQRGNGKGATASCSERQTWNSGDWSNQHGVSTNAADQWDGRKRKFSDRPCLGQFIGRIKSFNPTTGFGFIECEDIKEQGYCNDVFLHHSQMGAFEIGNEVVFTACLNSKGQPQATDLMLSDTTVVHGGVKKIKCESTR